MIYANAKRVGLVLSLLFMLVIIFDVPIAADTEETPGTHTDSYVMQYLEITVPDTYIKLTTTLKDSSESWTNAGIANPDAKKDEFETRGVVAAYYDPATNVLVYFIQKKSNEALEVFDITEYNEAQMVEYANSILPELENVETEVGMYKHPDMNMYRLKIHETIEDGIEEIVYGTIVNGMGIQFSVDSSMFISGANEDVLKSVVNNVRMTRKMTKAEYEQQVRKTWVTIGCFFGGGIVLMVVLFIISKQSKKRKKKKVEYISKRIYDFRQRKRKGEVDETTVKYVVETDYNAQLIEAYSTYNSWFRTIKRDIIAAVIYVGFVGYATYLGSKFVMIVGITVALLLLYFKFSGKEKFQDNMMKRYEIKKKKSVTAVYRFYDEYFTQSGIDSIAEYIYPQVFGLANYHGYLLLYISEENALVIDLEKIPEEDRLTFIKYIYEKSR